VEAAGLGMVEAVEAVAREEGTVTGRKGAVEKAAGGKEGGSPG